MKICPRVWGKLFGAAMTSPKFGSMGGGLGRPPGPPIGGSATVRGQRKVEHMWIIDSFHRNMYSNKTVKYLTLKQKKMPLTQRVIIREMGNFLRLEV